MKLDVNKIITLGNKEKYLIISHVTNNNKDYYYIAEVEENGKDIKENYKIMESTIDGDKVYLDEVVGETNLKTVLPLFVKDFTK
jgi:hypothetical protein